MGSGQLDATLHHLRIPLLRPFTTATGRVLVRDVGLVSVARGGNTGWGEAAPYPGQDESIEDVIDAAATGGMTPTLAAAIDEAVCDLVARERDESIVTELGPHQATVPISVAIGMGDDAITAVEQATREGIARFKVKVMPGRTGHVSAIRTRFPDAVIGIDANGSFDASTVPEILALGDLDLAYVEQPTASCDGPAVRSLAEAGFTVFADESVRSVSSARRMLGVAGVSGVVVKPGRLGWQSAVTVVKLARDSGKAWRASGLLETGVGRAYTLALASAHDAFVSDVAPASRFLTHDVASQQVLDGRMVVASGPGTGLDVSAKEVRTMATDVIVISGSVVPSLDL